MKVLVAYFSQTGNTKKIASAIYDEACLSSDAVLKKKVKQMTGHPDAADKASAKDFARSSLSS
jgi:flavodoxin